VNIGGGDTPAVSVNASTYHEDGTVDPNIRNSNVLVCFALFAALPACVG
jgi:hypothetical protein